MSSAGLPPPVSSAGPPCDAFACRVCHGAEGDGGKGGALVDPCLCDGSVRFVHRRCLNQWRLQGVSRPGRAVRCELCKATYRYEVKWVPHSHEFGELLLHGAAVAAPMVVVTGTYALWRSSLSDGLLMASTWLGAWALVDVLNTPFSFRVGSVAADRFSTAARTPRHHAERTRLAEVQAVARQKSESHARMIAEMRGTPLAEPLVEPGQDSVQLPDSDGSHTTADSGAPAPASQEALSAQGAELQSVPTPPTEAQATADADTDSDSDDDVEFQPPDSFRQRPPEPDGMFPCLRFRPKICCCLTTCLALALAGTYLAGVGTLLRSPLGRTVVWSAAALGSTYWGVAFLLLLLTILMGPRQCELVRGEDGFPIVRGLTAEERKALCGRAERAV